VVRTVLDPITVSSTRKGDGVRKTIVTLVAALGLLVAVTSASAAVLVEQGTIYGTTPGRSIQLDGTNTTTAYAFGVWTSHVSPLQIQYQATINCVHNANDRVVSGVLLASRTVSDAAFLWFGSRAIAGPWFGWDTCSIAVNISAPGLDNDDSMISWLVSHQ
jgi:hypothetical protein